MEKKPFAAGVLRQELHSCCNNAQYAAWADFFRAELQADYFARLDEQVSAAMMTKTVYPSRENIFRAFRTPAESVRCVILGQDPYHEPGQAMGLAFSVGEGIKQPPSLVNIEKELFSDLGLALPSGDLTSWAENGVFLLNTCLTVDRGEAFSHAKYGWQNFTLHALEYLANRGSAPMAAILWGKPAQKYAPVLQKGSRPVYILESAHPSPLSAYRGFFGSRPFSRVNEFLLRQGQTPIHWG